MSKFHLQFYGFNVIFRFCSVDGEFFSINKITKIVIKIIEEKKHKLRRLFRRFVFNLYMILLLVTLQSDMGFRLRRITNGLFNYSSIISRQLLRSEFAKLVFECIC
ncbi:hypothetical protein BpHYR1_041892 [Brachionus plicatilis]|uniref:Uncharacterized protein n=1 Tax=Brachionus plicatilis TaxID=10195 RepID=A0A3M7S1Q6_BRAPC|nr:hypothetical protein BpHYR1_041892 [Brachionus plicatilis]